MSTSYTRRTRSDRLAAIVPPGRMWRLFDAIRSGGALARMGLCLCAAMLLWGVHGAWAPPFAFRERFVSPRDIQARVSFQQYDEAATARARDDSARDVACVYDHDVRPLELALQTLKDDVFKVVRATSAEGMDAALWANFFPPPSAQETMPDNGQVLIFDRFRLGLAEDQELARFSAAVSRALSGVMHDGLLVDLDAAHRNLSHRLDEIEILPVHAPNQRHKVRVDNVRIEAVKNRLRPQLEAEFKSVKLAAELTEPVYHWLVQRLNQTATLKLDVEETKAVARKLFMETPEQYVTFAQNEDLVASGTPLTPAHIQLLRAEHSAFLAARDWTQCLAYSLAYFGMFVALFVLCGAYLAYRERDLLDDWGRLAKLLCLVVSAVLLYRLAGAHNWWAELAPMLLFSMTAAIAYRQETALLLTAVVSLVVVFSCGYGLAEFVTVMSAGAASILIMGRVRSRTKLLYDGIIVGAVAMLTCLGVGTLNGQHFQTTLLPTALWYGFSGVMAGLLMTGLLPFIERIFDVQTDISLLELGDAAHPLLQELVRRAPGTYNHSINVASIAEAAAEAIGANGLLVRVGAYFHDIGKMLKPGYFVENQGPDANRHESLVPTMSTLVIIAHVKDGADLARQYRLPQSIIDFIEQHHGTTLVEYFYNQAKVQSREDDPEAEPVDESGFRYPGPKPQTRETGVLMLADSVEGASRTLVDPTPARIENLVADIVSRRLTDGQFNECGLTLRELHLIEDSLVKSLTAVYHGRVKYPSQATA